MRTVTFAIERLERLAAKRYPGYLDACLACGTRSADGRSVTFDAESDCWQALLARKDAAATARHPFGPGTVVKRVLASMGIRQVGGAVVCPGGKRITGCGCDAFARRMNAWGWARCLTDKRGVILKWFAAKAKDCEVQLDAGLLADLFGGPTA